MSVNSMPGDGNTNLLASHGNPTGMSAKVPVSQGVWFHLAAVATANSLVMYVNGKMAATAPHLAGDLSICAAINAPMYLDGKVAGLRYSGMARYDADFVPEVYLPVDGDSQGNWPMWEGEGAVLADSSGNGNDGTATDGEWSSGGPACTQGGLCGDGTQTSWELCDDGNQIDDDGCQANCSVPLVPSVTMNGYTWFLAEKGEVCQTTCQALGKTCVDLVGINYVESSCSKAHAVCPNFFDGLPCVTDGDGPRVVYSGDTPVQCKWRNWNYPGMTCTYSAGGNTAHMCACQ